MQIELERIRHEAVPNQDRRLAVVIQPPVRAKQFVHQVVEHFVVAELDVTAEIPREAMFVDHRLRKTARYMTRFQHQPIAYAALVETPRGPEARRTSTDDQMANVHVNSSGVKSITTRL